MIYNRKLVTEILFFFFSSQIIKQKKTMNSNGTNAVVVHTVTISIWISFDIAIPSVGQRKQLPLRRGKIEDGRGNLWTLCSV